MAHRNFDQCAKMAHEFEFSAIRKQVRLRHFWNKLWPIIVGNEIVPEFTSVFFHFELNSIDSMYFLTSD